MYELCMRVLIRLTECNIMHMSVQVHVGNEVGNRTNYDRYSPDDVAMSHGA